MAMLRPGPGSVTWKVNRELIVLAGWGRAILLQLAHPAVAAGVHHHSAFRGSLTASFRRLHATAGAMVSITFGDTEEMLAAAARINRVHDRIKGPGYSAHDPELQRWVHATLVDSILMAYERLVAPLTAQERDRYCAEATIMESLLGMPHSWLPRDYDAVQGYLRETIADGTIAVTDTSLALAYAVLYPPKWWLLWPAFRPVQLMTIGLLPTNVRDAYGFAWTNRHERALTRWTRGLRLMHRLAPRGLREWPAARVHKVHRVHEVHREGVVALAAQLQPDVAELCAQMARLNHHENS